ncbi:MAG TPA: carbon storage regulator [Planctomycetaceae bacterium]|jgi:carbon storage regulator
MLVLSRKLGEKITIDGDIELEVLEITGNRIRLGVSAPQDCRIVRSECCFEPKKKVGSRSGEHLAFSVS